MSRRSALSLGMVAALSAAAMAAEEQHYRARPTRPQSPADADEKIRAAEEKRRRKNARRAASRPTT